MRRVQLLFLALVLGGCTTTRVLPQGEVAAVAPVLSVERFLAAANQGDLDTMARLFGTEDGPIIDTGGTLGCAFKKMGSWIGLGSRCLTIQEVEIRMDAIAQILRHEDYTVSSEASVPGRVSPASRVGVDLRIGGKRISDVPFVVVRANGGRWLVEEIGLTKITSGQTWTNSMRMPPALRG